MATSPETAELGFPARTSAGFHPHADDCCNRNLLLWRCIRIRVSPVAQNRDERTKKLQNMFFFWYKKENTGLIKNELAKIKRGDLWQRLTKSRGNQP
jgi:hypothetical protein